VIVSAFTLPPIPRSAGAGRDEDDGESNPHVGRAAVLHKIISAFRDCADARSSQMPVPAGGGDAAAGAGGVRAGAAQGDAAAPPARGAVPPPARAGGGAAGAPPARTAAGTFTGVFIVLIVSDTPTMTTLADLLPGLWPELNEGRNVAAAADGELEQTCYFCQQRYRLPTGGREAPLNCRCHPAASGLVRDPASLPVVGSMQPADRDAYNRRQLLAPGYVLTPTSAAGMSIDFRRSLVWSCCGAPFLKTSLDSNGCQLSAHVPTASIGGVAWISAAPGAAGGAAMAHRI